MGSKFKRQLHSLMAAIQRTEVQYVRCIKPNANKSKDELDCLMVVEQLRCAGVVEVRDRTKLCEVKCIQSGQINVHP